MAEPRIKAALESADFTIRATQEVRDKLNACLKTDSAHILPKARGGKDGPHVTTIQNALMKIRGAAPGLGIQPITDASGTYGHTTAAAVLKYKGAKGIKRSGQPLDDIVGRMTITQLDDDLRVGHLDPPGPGPQPGPGPGPGPQPSTTTIEVCKQNANITLNGTTAPVAAGTKMSAADWIKETQATFDTICAIPLGKSIVDTVRQKIEIIPYPGAEVSASTHPPVAGVYTIKFTASHIKSLELKPGGRADEALFHELIHMLDGLFHGYENPKDSSMDWSKADFFTINGANIYSLAVFRSLRKDHGDADHFALMPPRYATDSLEHMVVFMENYQRAFDRNKEVFNILRAQPVAWNPFKTFTPGVRADRFSVKVVQGKKWTWLYELFSDQNARWSDPDNVAEYGIGKWRQEGSHFVVDWKSGASDRFPNPQGGTSNGITQMARGEKYDTIVTNAPAKSV